MRYWEDTNDREERFPGFIKSLKGDVDEFFDSFSDDPKHTSRWAHHYFCKKEGGLLIYDAKKPNCHICSICGEAYDTDLLNGVWWTMYRNSGVTNAWKAAVMFKLSGEDKYLRHVVGFARFYSSHYGEFRLHNKEGVESESVQDAPWGTSRIMPQSLNEVIFIVRLINALEVIKDDLPEGFLEEIDEQLFLPAFELLKPQVREIHNISNWIDCGIAVMGLFTGNTEMVDFAFHGEFGLENQLSQGVTGDHFWYEGSIHYNMFLLEGVVNAILFAGLYDYEFSFGKDVVSRMLGAAYRYAFENHQFPNPNDGWPDVNLKTYSYIYSIGVKVLGTEDSLSDLLGSILNMPGERGTVPLSKPWYFQNDVSLEEFIFVPGLREHKRKLITGSSVNFKSSYCGLLKAYGSNLFLKYGHNGPSHAHPDKMHIEVILQDKLLSRDLSNSGYGNVFCNEWHRVSASHNTIVVNGKDHTGFGGGNCEVFEEDHIRATSSEVYPGVKFTRDVRLLPGGFLDVFEASAEEVSVFDYFFHVEGSALWPMGMETSELGLGYTGNGYQHLSEIKRITDPQEEMDIDWQVEDGKLRSSFSTADAEVFLAKSPDNPVVNHRATLIIRKRGKDARFKVNWEILEND